MRLLIVSYYFPPFNTIGAVRVGKTAAYLSRWGHDVRVLTAADQPLQPTLPVELDESQVVRSSWLNVNAPVEWALGGRARVAAQGYRGAAGRNSLMARLGRWYKTCVNFPDGQIGWRRPAVQAGKQLLKGWRPDLILASAMPPTSLVVADALSRQFDIPWVAEMRDLWVDEGSYQQPWWRRAIEKRWERQLLSNTTGIVTVSEPLADELIQQYHKPTTVVLNGFDPGDFAKAEVKPVFHRDPQKLRIVYTGMIYAGRRDPTSLFEAIKQLGHDGKRVQVEFYGRYLQPVVELAQRLGVAEQVVTHDAIGYHESLATQQQSDVLLLLVDADEKQRGVYTGKVFEYFGARRPILAIGPPENVATQLIAERRAGVVLREPAEIAQQLRRWLDEKPRGGIPSPPLSATVGLTRAEQVRVLERFLLEQVESQGAARAAA